MSEKNKIRDSDEEDDDGDYCPTTHDHEQSDASEESATHDDDDDKEEEKQSIKPFDESKADELWKNFTSSTKPSAPIIKESPKVTTTKVYDYAGEKVQVPTTTSSSLKRPAAPSMGSGSVLDRLGIGKKPKLSTLEKSRLDWDTYKETESITDDMNIHRRSKDSYVEKKAFLERSETREYDHHLTTKTTKKR